MKTTITLLLLVVFYFLQEICLLIDPIHVPNTSNMDKSNAIGGFHGCPNSPPRPNSPRSTVYSLVDPNFDPFFPN